MNEKLFDISNIVKNQLIPGDHDSLLFFGSDAQAKLQYFSKTMSEILLKNNDDLEISINQVLVNIEKFQGKPARKGFNFIYKTGKQRLVYIKKYNELLSYMDRMVVYLQIQQAQLLKDLKLLDYMNELINDCNYALELNIQEGESVLEHSQHILLNMEDDNNRKNLEEWNERLDHRIESLRISYTISNQSIVQLQLMKKNNRKIVDRIIDSVTGTIPVWRNQVSLLLGIEKYNQNLNVQNKVVEIATKYVKDNASTLNKRMRLKGEEIDLEQLKKINTKLTEVLQMLLLSEQEDDSIRINLKQSIRS